MKSCPVARHEMYTIFEDGRIHSGKLDIYLRPRLNRNGYLIVTLNEEQLAVHRLVAAHFIPNPYSYPQVNHLNGIKVHNEAANLEWVSAEQNAQHALETGLRKGFVHVDVRRSLLARVLQGEAVADLAVGVGNHPNVLNKMLRLQAEKDGLTTAWQTESKRKRRLAAVKNLELVNARD